jgi:hypothetical protein
MLLWSPPARAQQLARRTPSSVQTPRRTAPVWVPPTAAEWTTNARGLRSDRVNGYIEGSLSEVRALFKHAGWAEAVPATGAQNLRYVGAVARQQGVRLLNALTHNRFNLKAPVAAQTIQTMPVSPQTEDGNPAVVAFEKGNQPFGGRHHFRMFDTGNVSKDGRPIWAIAASRDTRLKVVKDWHRMFIDHAIEPNADHERDVVARDAAATGRIARTEMLQLPADAPRPEEIFSKDGRAFYLVVRPENGK